ncbi:hypothetical protein HDV00_001628 [Rhizophlyctis rosea]|nr:hypothetical protein HDV00_001628 [Rhizophlyctis rosea]
MSVLLRALVFVALLLVQVRAADPKFIEFTYPTTDTVIQPGQTVTLQWKTIVDNPDISAMHYILITLASSKSGIITSTPPVIDDVRIGPGDTHFLAKDVPFPGTTSATVTFPNATYLYRGDNYNSTQFALQVFASPNPGTAIVTNLGSWFTIPYVSPFPVVPVPVTTTFANITTSAAATTAVTSLTPVIPFSVPTTLPTTTAAPSPAIVASGSSGAGLDVPIFGVGKVLGVTGLGMLAMHALAF